MSPTTPAEQLDRMITGYWISQAVYAAAHFGIADLLNDGPKPVSELAQRTSTNEDALFRLLRALASQGVFVEGPARVFALTPLAEPLQSAAPHSKRALALMTGSQQFSAWSEILYSIETGKPAFDKVYEKPIFDYLAENPASAAVFDAAMTGIHGRESAAIADAYDFQGIRTLADIGGGNGSTISAILKRHPDMSGILFDLPHVVERARRRIQDEGLKNRCQLIGGNFFESVPSGADAYFLRHIIHDWTDAQCEQILRCCHAAMPASGRLLVVESVIPPGNEPFGGKFLDLTMLLIPGGKERTGDEYRSLCARAGFELVRIVPTTTEVSVLEARKL